MAILDRIKRSEDETANGRGSLESSDHADWRGFRPSFRAIVAIGFIAVGSLALYAAIRHESKIAARPSGSEIQFRIVTRSGQPVVGAVVSPRSFSTSDPQGEIEEMRRHMRGGGGGRGQTRPSRYTIAVNENFFPADKMVFPPTTTDADGIARIVIPDDEALVNAGYPAARLESLREALRQPIVSVRLHVDHRHRVGAPAGADDDRGAVRQKNGRALGPNLALPFRMGGLASENAPRWMRIVYVPDDGPAWFSELIDLRKQTGPPISLDVTLKPGARIEGRLSDDVSRPVENGWVVAAISNGTELQDGFWSAAAQIDPNGTFVLESLPEGGDLELVALCDEWISQSHTSDEIKAYARQTGFGAAKYDERLSWRVYNVFPRLYRLDAAVVEASVPMAQTSDVAVTVLDETGQPIPNALVGFSPNQCWFRGGASHVGDGIDFLSLMRAELASGKRRTTAIAWVPTHDDIAAKHVRSQTTRTENGGWRIENVLRYSAMTDAQGVAVIPNLPYGSTAQATQRRELQFQFQVDHDQFVLAAPSIKRPHGEFSMVDVVPGKPSAVTVRMKRK